MNLEFLRKIKTRDAALIFAFLQERKGFGAVGEYSFEKLAQELNTESLKTSRGADFTAAVVRSKMNELEGVAAIETEKTSANSFELFVFLTSDTVERIEAEAPRVDHYGGRTLFDFQNENENENETSEILNAHKEEYIYINKKINNQENLKAKEQKKTKRAEVEQDVRPTTDDTRSRINWDDPKVSAYRRLIVKRIWERGINPDLIDRTAALAILKIGGINAKQVSSMISEAIESFRRYQRTDGKSGRSAIWKTLALLVKRAYETAGWKWTPTRIANEPEPAAEIITTEPVEVEQKTNIIKPASTSSSALEYSAEEIGQPFEKFVCVVARRENLGAMEARGRAVIIRNAARSAV